MSTSSLEEKSILQKAVEAADFKTIRKELLRNPQACQYRDKRGRSMLHFAFGICKRKDLLHFHGISFYGKVIIEILKIFLNLGLDVDLRTAEGKTPLWLAMECQLEIVVRFLVSRGADVKVTNENGDNLALGIVRKFMAFASIFTPDFCKELIDMGIDVDAPNKNGQTAFRSSIDNELLCIARLFALSTREINFVNGNGKSIVHIMMEYNDFDAQHLKKLIMKGVRLDVADNNGRTPTHLAANLKAVPKSIVDLLLNSVNDIDVQDHYGNTMLHYATRFPCNVQLCEALIGRGADVCKKDVSGFTPIQIAAIYRNSDVLKMLQKFDVRFDILTHSGETLLHLISKNNFHRMNALTTLEIVGMLHRNGCHIDTTDLNFNMTPLHVAAGNNVTDMVKALLLHGACVNSENSSGSTPLHIASCTGSPETLMELIQGGASVSLKDKTGRLPLEIAISADNVLAVRHLLDNGADINEIATTQSQINFLKRVKREKKCWFSLTNHCALLKSAKIPLSDMLWYIVDCEKLQRQFQEFESEVEILEMYEIEENISLLDVLRMNTSSRIRHADKLRRIAVCSEFDDLRQLIPNYKNFIFSRFKQAVEKKNIRGSAVAALNILTEFKLTDVCSDIICSYLSNSDLLTLIRESKLRQ